MELLQQFIIGFQKAPWYEYLAVVTGIISVWLSKKESVLVYPFGLVSTIIYIYLSIEGSLFGEATVNLYYTVMSLVGWYMWIQKDVNSREVQLHISNSNKKEWVHQLAFFLVLFGFIFLALTFLKKGFYPNVIPVVDAFATASAFTGMYLMVKKKVESWYWWLITNAASIPLYFVKGYFVTTIYYSILLVLAFYGLLAWKKKVQKKLLHDATAYKNLS